MLINKICRNCALDVYRRFLSPKFLKVAVPRAGKALNNKIAVVFHRDYLIQLFGLESLHAFDTSRYATIYAKLVNERLLVPGDVFVPSMATDEELRLIHYDGYLESLRDPAKVAECLESLLMDLLPASWTEKVVNAFKTATGGTILAAALAMEHGIAISLGGGFHHAKPGFGEGFCLFADIPIAIKKLKATTSLKKVLIVDLDVHQGNGNIVSLYEDFDTFIFSMHQRHIYPSPREVGDLDIDLEEGTGDEAYMKILEDNLPGLFEKARPEMVFYVAGCDPLRGDRLASLELSPEGILARDKMVISACRERNVPVVMTLAGGYHPSAGEVQYQSIRSIIKQFC